MDPTEGAAVFGAVYGRRAWDLTRYVNDPLDEEIASVLHAASTSDVDSWVALRGRLSVDDHYSLMSFADRRAAFALRTGRSDLAMSAIEALSLLAAERVDYRDLDVDFAVYAVQATHGDVAKATAFASTRAHQQMRSLFKSRFGRRLSLADCGWLSFQTRHGLGFIRTWAPVPSDLSLLTAAVTIADRIDDRGGYEDTTISLAHLGWGWFRREPIEARRRADEIPNSGCVSITADIRDTRWKPSLLVFLADVADAATARVLVDLARGASDPHRPRQAVSREARLLVAVGITRTGGDDHHEIQRELAALVDDVADTALSDHVSA